MKNLRARRHHEERKKGIGSQNYLSEQNAAGSNLGNYKKAMGALYLEMEDWYRGAERHGMVQAV